MKKTPDKSKLNGKEIAAYGDFMKLPEGQAIMLSTRLRLKILDNMCGKFNLDVNELAKVFEEAYEKNSYSFRDHDLVVLDYLVEKVGNTSEIEQMKEMIAQEVLLMEKINEIRGINNTTT